MGKAAEQESAGDAVPSVTLHQDRSPALERSLLCGDKSWRRKPNTKTKSKENQTVHSPGSGDYGGFFFLIPAIDVILFVL